MNVLIIGPGVIGTVYGTQLGAAGHAISVVEHGNRTDVIAARGLHARDVSSGVETHAPVRVVSSAGAPDLDVVLVALRRDHLQSALGPTYASGLTRSGSPCRSSPFFTHSMSRRRSSVLPTRTSATPMTTTFRPCGVQLFRGCPCDPCAPVRRNRPRGCSQRRGRRVSR